MKTGTLLLVPALLCGSAAAEPVSFRNEVIAVLTRAGCNSGTCHGSPSGKNGFRLSLRGYDPESDYRSLTEEIRARRIDRLDPRSSLILLKPSMEVPHQGGLRLEPGSAEHRILLDWVAEGARLDPEGSPRLESIAVIPERAAIEKPSWSLRLRVEARFSDGSLRDVTSLARFGVNREEIASVTPDGMVQGAAPGEAAISIDYLDHVTASVIAFVDEPAGFTWIDPPEGNYIDAHVFAKLRLLRILPTGLSSDSEFLRRVTLDAIGLIPTPEEARRFLADQAADKRSRLIDALLERPEFAAHWGKHWSDRLGCNQRFVGKLGAYKYHAWIVNAMAVNMPEDEFVRALLTASGGNYRNPPASFYRRLRDPDAAAETVSQLFLGVRLQCARCHNHPGERWTQNDYQGMAAFFTQVRFKDGPFFNHLYDKEETVFADRGAGNRPHPRTGQPVPPRFLGGAAPEIPSGADRRVPFARWLTGPENPQFARAAVNRIWHHLFGRGIVEPVDDFRSTNPPANEPLLEALAADFTRGGYDRKRLIRTILNSRTYQLASDPGASGAGPDAYFARAEVRLLGAEQLLDAISLATGVPEPFAGLPGGFHAAEIPDGEYSHDFLKAFGRPARAMACECERESDTNPSQALQLAGGRVIERKLRAADGRSARLAASDLEPDRLLDELFLAALSRYPQEAERSALRGSLETSGDRRRAIEDILWSLLNHPEFLFQH